MDLSAKLLTYNPWSLVADLGRNKHSYHLFIWHTTAWLWDP